MIMVMIYICAAFGTLADIHILLQRLRDDFGLCGAVGRWFESYMCGRSCQVSVKGSVSSETQLKYGNYWATTLYSYVIGQIIGQHAVLFHIYADYNVQFLTFNLTIPGDAACVLFKLSRSIKNLQIWMTNNKLNSWWILTKPNSPLLLLIITMNAFNTCLFVLTLKYFLLLL